MQVRTNRVKQLLREGKVIFSTGVRLPEPGLVEILGYVGFDFVLIDGEHGAMGWSEMERMILAAFAADTVPIVRVRKNEPEMVMRALDIGAMGILIPHCRSAEDAQRFVNAALYPPDGHRGIGPGRGRKWGGVPTYDYYRSINDETVLIAMIEDPEAVDRIDEIVEVEGIDVLWVGTGDLAAGYGFPGQTTHPMVIEASAKVLESGRRKGIAIGLPARDVEHAREAIQEGYRAISYGGAETFVFKSGHEYLKAVRGSKESTIDQSRTSP